MEPEKEDIYAFFNISSNASKDEINSVYRRLSKIYHPDMHMAPELKDQAQFMFNKINRFYNILIDEQKRQFYDSLGVDYIEQLSQIDTEFVDPITGQMITPMEFRSKFEQAIGQAEEEKWLQRTNPQGSINVKVDACDLFRRNKYVDEYDDWTSLLPSVSEVEIAQSVDASLGSRNRFTIGGQVGAYNGIGDANLSLACKSQLTNYTRCETSLLVGDTSMASVNIHGPLFDKIYGASNVSLALTPNGIQPEVSFEVKRILQPHLTGSIRFGIAMVRQQLGLSIVPSINTSLLYDDSLRRQLLGYIKVNHKGINVGLSTMYRFRDENGSVLKASINLSSSLKLHGSIGFARKIINDNFLGCSCHFVYPTKLSLKLRWSRAHLQYSMTIAVCDEEITKSALLFSVILPAALFNISYWFVRPYLKRWREKIHDQEEQLLQENINQLKQGAIATIDLMKETASNIQQREEAINGLIIIEAIYGATDDVAMEGPNSSIWNVTIPLQVMVVNSRLSLQASSKAFLPGFINISIEKVKSLRIVYKFDGKMHLVVVDDKNSLNLPNSDHKIEDEAS